MGAKSIKEVLNKEIQKIDPSIEIVELIQEKAKEIKARLESNIKKKKIKAEVFFGGSFAKETLIKKDRYDVDVFVRFSQEYKEEEISKKLNQIILSKAVRIHGSRDYYKIKENDVEFEIIPVIKIGRPQESRNVTDLSYFHVNYIKNKIRKNKKLADEIKLTKAFIHYSGCYGAESYIRGFSGYAVELLISHYKSFIKFIEAVVKIKENEKIIIDDEKYYKNKENILMEMNEAKLDSPIILIDPTYKTRNALAGLSEETFLKFREQCRKFLNNPDESFFENKDEKKDFFKKNKNIVELKISTDRQAGDIAGTKMKKFYNYFLLEAGKYFLIKNSLFDYSEKENIGRCLISAFPKKEIIFLGPLVGMEEQLKKFKKEHKKIKLEKGRYVAVEKNFKDFREFFEDFLLKRSKIIEEMGISDLRID